MISKELLESVLGFTSGNVFIKEIETKNNDIEYLCNIGGWTLINIYELAHKCKEWAYKQSSHNVGYAIKTVHYGDSVIGGFVGIEESYIDTCKTEFELVLKLCQWILDKRNLCNDK